MTAITIAIGKLSLAATLGDGPAARALAAALPVSLPMSRWGDEYYGSLPAKLPAGEPRRDVYEVGELALWPDGNALCLFFGPTPASHGSEPRMASPGIPLGRVTTGTQGLASLDARITATVSRAEA